MLTSFPLPNGGLKTVSALTPQELSYAVQDLTLQLLGVTLPLATATNKQIDAVYRQCRIEWPTQGSPTWRIDEDVCFIRVVNATDDNMLIRNTTTENTPAGTVLQQTYGQSWRVTWTLYGPQSSARALYLHSALLEDYALTVLGQLGLSITTGFRMPDRVPENFSQQWWERSDLSAVYNETVVSTQTIGTIAFVPLSIGVQRDGKIQSVYGTGGYGVGTYGGEYLGEITDTTTVQAGPTGPKGQ